MRLAAVVATVGAALVVAGVLVRQGPAPFGSRTLVFACAGAICVWDGKHDTRRVVARGHGGYASNPVWSPDGTRLAFIHTQDRGDVSITPRRDLYVIDADGSNRVRLVAGVADTVYGLPFAWAPDATSLAVSLQAPESRVRLQTERALLGPRGDLYLVDVMGGARRRLTRSSTAFDGYPAWVSPRRVVYARVRPYREFPLEAPHPYEIRVIDSVSGRDRLVLRRRGDVLDLVASPDGRQAAVLDAGVHAFLLDLESGHQTALVRRPPLLDGAWSPDGRLLALNGPAIIDPRTKRLRRETSHNDCFDPDWSPDGRWLVCHVGYGEEDEKRRGGSDLVLVSPTTGARVALTDSATAQDASWRPPAKPVRTR